LIFNVPIKTSLVCELSVHTHMHRRDVVSCTSRGMTDKKEKKKEEKV
jgi:hypothetical protein